VNLSVHFDKSDESVGEPVGFAGEDPISLDSSLNSSDLAFIDNGTVDQDGNVYLSRRFDNPFYDSDEDILPVLHSKKRILKKSKVVTPISSPGLSPVAPMAPKKRSRPDQTGSPKAKRRLIVDFTEPIIHFHDPDVPNPEEMDTQELPQDGSPDEVWPQPEAFVEQPEDQERMFHWIPLDIDEESLRMACDLLDMYFGYK